MDERAPAAVRPRHDGEGSLDRARRRRLAPASLPVKEPWRPLWGLTYKDYEALPADGRRYEPHEQQACRARSPWGAKDVADRQDETTLNALPAQHSAQGGSRRPHGSDSDLCAPPGAARLLLLQYASEG